MSLNDEIDEKLTVVEKLLRLEEIGVEVIEDVIQEAKDDPVKYPLETLAERFKQRLDEAWKAEGL